MTPREFIRKFGLAAVVAIFTSCCAYVFLGWLYIYPLGAEHPEVAPRRLFEDLLSAVVWVTAIFACLQLVALGCAFRLVAKASALLVAIVAGVVPAFILTLSLLFRRSISFDTPPGAVVFLRLLV